MGAVLRTIVYLGAPSSFNYDNCKTYMDTATLIGETYRHIPVVNGDNLTGVNLDWGTTKEEFQTNINNTLQVIDDISITPPVAAIMTNTSGYRGINRAAGYYKGTNTLNFVQMMEYYPTIDTFAVMSAAGEIYWINNKGWTRQPATRWQLSNLQFFFFPSTTSTLGYDLKYRKESYRSANCSYTAPNVNTELYNEIMTAIYNCYDMDPHYSTTVVDTQPIEMIGNYSILTDAGYEPTEVLGKITVPVWNDPTITNVLEINSTDTQLPSTITGNPVIHIENSSTFNYNTVDFAYNTGVGLLNTTINAQTSGIMSSMYLNGHRDANWVRTIAGGGILTGANNVYPVMYPYGLIDYKLAIYCSISITQSSITLRPQTYPYCPLVNHLVAEPTGYTVSVVITPENGGIVNGDGLYHNGDTVHLLAAANDGYVFDGWWMDAGLGVSVKLGEDKELTIPDIHNDYNIEALFKKITSPYDPANPSSPGGGNGSYDDTDEPINSDLVNNAIGLLNNDTATVIYTPSQAQYNSLIDYLYGTDFIAAINNFSDKVASLGKSAEDYILNLYMTPFEVPSGGPKAFTMGLFKSSITMNVASNRFMTVNMGSINIEPYWNNALDYKCKIQIYIPYIGYKDLDTAEVMGETISLSYAVDLLTGKCIAYILVNNSVHYQFTGDIAYKIPLSPSNYSDQILASITPAITSGALITAGAASPVAAGLIGSGMSTYIRDGDEVADKSVQSRNRSTASNVMSSSMNIGGDVSRSGALDGNLGFISVQTPYVIINRPRLSLPKNMGHYHGYPSNITSKLGDLTGYTEVGSIHLEGIPCTLDEMEEIEALLKGGVIL